MVETTGRAICYSRDCAQFRRNFAVKEKSTVSPVEFNDVKLCINSSSTKPAEDNKKLCSSFEKFLSSPNQTSITPLTPPSTAPAERSNRHTCCHALKNQCAASYSSQSSSSPLRALPFFIYSHPDVQKQSLEGGGSKCERKSIRLTKGKENWITIGGNWFHVTRVLETKVMPLNRTLSRALIGWENR